MTQSFDLDAALGIDSASPEFRRALALEEADHDLRRCLIALRHKLELSQADVARLLDISQPSVASFERYDNDPRLSTVRRYALAVGATVRHVVTHADLPTDAGWVNATLKPSVRTSASVGDQVVARVDRAWFALAA